VTISAAGASCALLNRWGWIKSHSDGLLLVTVRVWCGILTGETVLLAHSLTRKVPVKCVGARQDRDHPDRVQRRAARSAAFQTGIRHPRRTIALAESAESSPSRFASLDTVATARGMAATRMGKQGTAIGIWLSAISAPEPSNKSATNHCCSEQSPMSSPSLAGNSSSACLQQRLSCLHGVGNRNIISYCFSILIFEYSIETIMPSIPAGHAERPTA
jgi:hypothetical protein